MYIALFEPQNNLKQVIPFADELTEARKWLSEMASEGTANLQQWAELATPDERPNGDCDTEKGRGHL